MEPEEKLRRIYKRLSSLRIYEEGSESAGDQLRLSKETVRQKEHEVQILQNKLRSAELERDEYQVEVDRIRNSFSWKLSAPLRFIRTVFITLPGQAADRLLAWRVAPGKKQRKEAKKKAVHKKKDLQREKPRAKQKTQPNCPERTPLVLALFDTAIEKEIGGDLRNPGLFRRHAELAVAAKISGFCYDIHLQSITGDFDGVVSHHLNNTEIELKYCVRFTRDSIPNTVRSFGVNTKLAFIRIAAQYFEDQRYVTVAGKPLIVVENIEPHDYEEYVEEWRWYCLENGLGEIFVLSLDGHEVEWADGVIQSVDYAYLKVPQFPVNSPGWAVFLRRFQSDLRQLLFQNKAVDPILFLESWNDRNNDLSLMSVFRESGEYHKQFKEALKNVETAYHSQILLLITDENTGRDFRSEVLDEIERFKIKLMILNLGCGKAKTGSREYFLWERKNNIQFLLERYSAQGVRGIVVLCELDKNTKDQIQESQFPVLRLSHTKASTKETGKWLTKSTLEEIGFWVPRVSAVVAATDVISSPHLLKQIANQEVPVYEVLVLCRQDEAIVLQIENINQFAKLRLVFLDVQSEIDCVEKLAAIKRSKGEFVWFVGNSCQPKKSWLKGVLQGMRENKVVLGYSDVENFGSIVTGRPAVEDNPCEDLCIRNFISDLSAVVVRKEQSEKVLVKHGSVISTFKEQGIWLFYLLLSRQNIFYKAKFKTKALSSGVTLADPDEGLINTFVLQQYFSKEYDLSVSSHNILLDLNELPQLLLDKHLDYVKLIDFKYSSLELTTD